MGTLLAALVEAGNGTVFVCIIVYEYLFTKGFIVGARRIFSSCP
jgi:hypothetical protein